MIPSRRTTSMGLAAGAALTCLAAGPAVASAAHHTQAAAPRAAAAFWEVRSGTTVLNPDPTDYPALIKAGFAVAPTAPAKVVNLSVVFPVVGGNLNRALTRGTIRQSGGLAISKGGKTIKATNAVANLTTHVVTATVTGKGRGFPMFTIGRAAITRNRNTATSAPYTVTISKRGYTYLDNTFKTTAFRTHKRLGTATTKVRLRRG